MISVADESNITKTFPMESLSHKKVLSECNQYLERGVCFNSAKEDCHSSDHSSKFEKENVPTNAFTCSMNLNSLGSPPTLDKPTFWKNSNFVTPDKGKGKIKTSIDTMNQATSSIDFSVLTAADFGINPESFTKHQGRAENRFKKLRRRSTIGVRGSPGNDALIRYIAHRKRMRAEEPPSQASPFQRNVLLKDKIAAFQSSFKPLEESEDEMIHTPSISKKAEERSHEQSQLDQVGPSEYKAVALEETLNCESANGAKTPAYIQAVPVLHPNTVESRCLLLEVIPAAGISNTTCGIQSKNTKEGLSSGTTSQQSCKKVRFAEKQTLEIFDETRLPITPLQKGQLPSLCHDNSCLRSVLKKTPVRMLTEDTKEHVDVDYTNTRKGNEELSVFQSCGSLQTERSTRPIDKVEVHSEEADVKVFDTFQPVDTPVHRGEVSFSPTETRDGNSFNTTPIKNPFSQPNFDSDDGLQEISEAVSTVDSVVNTETKVSSPDLHATCTRVTRSSAKKVNKVEETSVRPTREIQTKRTCTTSKVLNPRKFQNGNSVTKSASKKNPASRRKVFGKRKKKKKTQKVYHGSYETVSKKPLLSPIPEMTEDNSLSYQRMSESSISILDHSCSSLGHETPEEANSILHNTEESGSCLYSNLSAVKENALPDAVSCSFLQLQDAVPNDMPSTFPLEPSGKDSSKDLKNILNGQVLKSDYSSESEMELVQGTGEKNRKETSFHLSDSAIEQPSGGDICVNFKRFPRRSRRITPNVEDFQSETPGNNPCVPRDTMEELPSTPQTLSHSGFVNDVLHAIEESFRSIASSTQKRVRRSTRQLKNAESEGLAWISVPAENSVNLVGSDRKARKSSCDFYHPESETFHQKQENLVQTLSPMMEDQKSVHVGVEHCRPKKKRKSICSRGQGGNESNVIQIDKQALVFKSN
ncbi:cell division cycle-associated protein 2 isoform X2 [Paroedura picta]|uniref:cell division cycle-associated protein 2 isoform X2 n=1 Tax=Paroedura picta TaxID=143630 RepID=UPI0040565F1D